VTRRDSLQSAESIRHGEVRQAVVPRDFIQSLPMGEGSPWAMRQLADGRWHVAIGEVDLAAIVVSSLKHWAAGGGRQADRRYELLRLLTTPEEWEQAETMIAHAEELNRRMSGE
jgi:hypothetical protein